MSPLAPPKDEEKIPAKPPRWKVPAGSWVLTLDETQCARLRELPNWSGRDEDFVAEDFLGGKASRWAAALSGIPAGTELRVLVDQFSRQAFLIDGQLVVHIDSF